MIRSMPTNKAFAERYDGIFKKTAPPALTDRCGRCGYAYGEHTAAGDCPNGQGQWTPVR